MWVLNVFCHISNDRGRLHRLYLDFSLFIELNQRFFSFFKSERRWNLIIKVKFNCFKDYMALYVDNVAKPIDKITATVNLSALIVQQFSATDLAANNNEVAKVVNFKSTHNVSKLKVRNLSLHTRLFHACSFINSRLLWLIFFV